MNIFRTARKSIVAVFAACVSAAVLASCTPAAAANAVSPTETDYLVLVNKTNKLPDDYEAKLSLVTVKNCFGKEFQVEKETCENFSALREDLLQSGIQIELESAYRSVARQKELIEELRATEGDDYVKNYAAVPGYSEHHTGLALDVTVVENGKATNDVYGKWETPYQKMHRKLAEHGFILRYPPGKTAVTGYAYESWHCRYVGKETARKIFLQGLTLEEYLAGGAETESMRGKFASAEYWARRNPAGDRIIEGKELDGIRKKLAAKSSLLTDMANFPKYVSGDYVREKIAAAKENFWWFEADKLYAKRMPLNEQAIRKAEENCNTAALPSRIEVRHALACARGNLRYLPESNGWYDDEHDTHYDLLQGAAINPAEPVAVLAESGDKKFYFAVMRNCTGWISKDEIVFTDRKQWLKYAAPKNFLVVTAAKKKIDLGDNRQLTLQMGARLPLADSKQNADGSRLVLMPVKANVKLQERTIRLPLDDTVHEGWLPYSENTVLRQAFRFLGELYGWSGLEGGVDCSLFTADVYRSMGIDLPADAVEQRLILPKSVNLDNMDTKSKMNAVLGLRPGDFLFTEGHVVLYLGTDESGVPHIIHAESSRYFPGEGDDGPLKYFTRRVLVTDFSWYKTADALLTDKLISIGSIK